MKVFSESGFDFSQEGLHILSRRLDQELTAVFLKALAEEIEAFFNVRDTGFVL